MLFQKVFQCLKCSSFAAANFRSKKDKKEKKGQKETVEEQDSPEAKAKQRRDGGSPIELVAEIWRENPVECWSFIQLSCRLCRFQVVQGFSHRPQSVGSVKDDKRARG